MDTSPRSRPVPTNPLRRLAASCLLVASVAPHPACVALFDVPPGRVYEVGPDGRQRDACTDHHAGAAFDVILGTLALAGGLLGFGLSPHIEGFAGVGIVGVGGAIGHFASAGSSQVKRCQKVRGP